MDPTNQQTRHCQCCSTLQGTMKNMMTETYQSIEYSEMLRICFGLNLLDDHQPPPPANAIRNICFVCEMNLKSSFDFREQCYKSQKLLKERNTLPLAVKDEPVSDEEPLILCTASLNKTSRGRGRPPKSDVTFTQVFVKTNTKTVEAIVKIESSSSIEKAGQESPSIVKPMAAITAKKVDDDNTKTEFEDDDYYDKAQLSNASSDSEGTMAKFFEEPISNDPHANLLGRFMCYVCDEYFDTFLAFVTHRDNHDIYKNHIASRKINRACLVCKESVKGYVKHLAEHHPDYKPNECLQCVMKTQDPRRLQEHLGIHSKKKIYKCRGCKLHFRTTTGLHGHLKTFQHKKGQYQCIRCGLCFRLFVDLDDHYHKDHKRKAHKHLFPCYVCKRVFGINKCIMNHKCNPIVKKKSKTDKTDPPTVLSHKCPLCDQRFDNADEMFCHKISLCVGRFGCNVEGCGRMFTRQRDLSHHFNQEHDAVKICDQCGFSTNKINEMKYHKIKVHDPNYQKATGEFPCRECGKVLHTKYSFDTHTTNHLPRKFFECHLCPARFQTRESIKSHMVKHLSSELLHSCSVCNKEFMTKAMLENHMKKHRSTLH
jgi:hypothetical protein